MMFEQHLCGGCTSESDSVLTECCLCVAGGRCIDERNGFRCMCPSGWSGVRCTENTNDCSMAPCLNGGTCKDGVNDFECRCPPGFVGELCQTNIDDCLNWPCANGGTCHDLVNDFRCDCAPGFEGKDCRLNVDECSAAPCLHGGNCTDQVNDYECQCPEGYYGKSCEFPDGFVPQIHEPLVPPPETPHTPVVVVGGDVGESRDGDESGPTVKQLVLIIGLGVGIPIIIIIVIIAFLLWNMYRRRNSTADASAPNNTCSKENAENEIINNKTKSYSVDTSRNHHQPSSAQTNMCVNIHNEDSRTLPPKKENNTDKLYKHYNKDLISNNTAASSRRGVHSSCSYNHRDILDDRDLKKPVKSSHRHQHLPHDGGIQTIDSLKKSLDIESSSTSADSVMIDIR